VTTEDGYLARRTRNILDAYANYATKCQSGAAALNPEEILSFARTSLTKTDFVHGMSLNVILSEFKNGDETSWNEEFDWITTNNEDNLNRVIQGVKLGTMPPVELCFAEMRVIDGHHRILAHSALGLEMIPVCDAWSKG
jgi:hypothetical protein